MSHLETIDLASLSTISGGQARRAQQPQQQPEEEGPPRRTWGQVAREYGAACVMGAGQSMVYGGRPRSWRQGLGQAAAGCAMGMGMRAIEDIGGLIGG